MCEQDLNKLGGLTYMQFTSLDSKTCCPETREERNRKYLAGFYKTNQGLHPLTAHNSETGFPKYILVSMKSLEGILEKGMGKSVVKQQNFMPSPKLFTPPTSPHLLPSPLPAPPSSGTLFTSQDNWQHALLLVCLADASLLEGCQCQHTSYMHQRSDLGWEILLYIPVRERVR